MQKSSAPLQFVLPFAANAGTGYRHTIPVPSQTGTDPALASYNDGFPPATMEQSGAGGLPPYGQDMNGVLYAATLALQWQQAGFMYPYSSAFATASTVSGYPAGALLLGSGGYNLWLSLGDNNQTNPDASTGTGWVPVFANAGATTVNTTGGSVTLSQNQLTSELINITGALTSNLTLVLPLTNGARYLVKNSTTGAFTVIIQGATGSGVSISSSVPQHVFTDGTNFYGVGLTGGPYLPLSGTAAAATQLATARTIAMTGDIAWTSGAFDGTANVTGVGTIQAGAVTLAKMAAFQANSLIGNPTGSSAAPSAITLASPLQFSGTTLGLSYTPVNKAGDTMTGNLAISGGTLTLNRNSTDYNAINLINSGGVQTQLSANGNGEGELRTVTNHPLNLIVNNIGVLLLTTNGVAQFTNQLDVNTHGVNTANIVLNPPASSSVGGSITFNHVNGNQWCAYSTAGLFNVGYTTGGGGPNPKMTISTAGNLTATGTIQPGSDARVKANQTKIENALNVVRRYLVGNTYNRRDNNGAFQAGFIADKVQEGLPHLVSESKEKFNGYERFKTLDYNGAEAYLANAITELHDIVLAQARRIDVLENVR